MTRVVVSRRGRRGRSRASAAINVGRLIFARTFTYKGLKIARPPLDYCVRRAVDHFRVESEKYYRNLFAGVNVNFHELSSSNETIR